MYTGRMDKTKIKNILKSFRNGATDVAACKAAGINVSTLWRWCNKWPNLGKRIEEIQKCRTGFVINAIYINAMNGKEASQKLWLEKEGLLKKGDINVSVPLTVAQKTEVSIPVATPEEADRVKSYAQLIRSHNLVSRVLGQDGYESVSGGVPEGQQRDPSPAGANP